MTTYNVTPKGGGKSGWKVEANGRIVSRHRKKRTALAKARELADSGDEIIKHDANGRIQDRMRAR